MVAVVATATAVRITAAATAAVTTTTIAVAITATTVVVATTAAIVTTIATAVVVTALLAMASSILGALWLLLGGLAGANCLAEHLKLSLDCRNVGGI